eukprot:338901-Rhodomonas_salina.2
MFRVGTGNSPQLQMQCEKTPFHGTNPVPGMCYPTLELTDRVITARTRHRPHVAIRHTNDTELVQHAATWRSPRTRVGDLCTGHSAARA